MRSQGVSKVTSVQFTTRADWCSPSLPSPAWFTTIHLSSSTLQVLYDIPKGQAANAASVILLASTPLYPVLGWLFDKRPHVMRSLYLAVPCAVAASYAILLLVRLTQSG